MLVIDGSPQSMENHRGILRMRRPPRVIQAALVAGGVLTGSLFAQSSTSYRMERLGFTTGATGAASAHWQTSVTISPDSRTGASSACNTGFRVSLGFLPVAISLPVPIELTVLQSQADQRDVELIWTGADPIFRVYRGSSPSNVSDITNLYQETSFCAFTDYFTLEQPILYYLVLPKP